MTFWELRREGITGVYGSSATKAENMDRLIESGTKMSLEENELQEFVREQHKQSSVTREKEGKS